MPAPRNHIKVFLASTVYNFQTSLPLDSAFSSPQFPYKVVHYLCKSQAHYTAR